jgi:putative tryptophan/tyrosine transport system substrate-binding protein
MKRRELIAFASGMLIFPSVSSLAQAPPKAVRLGIIEGDTREGVAKLAEEPFLDRLAKLGYVEGQNLIVERRYADGNLSRLPALAAEIIAWQPDLIFAPPGSATAAVKALTTTIPIVFCFVTDPVALGFAQSLAHPGGNLTGMSNLFSGDIAGKRVELLKELVPGLTRLAIWNNPAGVSDALELKAVEDAATKLDMQFLAIAANKPAEYEAAAAATREWGADAVYLNANPVAAVNGKQIIALMAAAKLPTMYFTANFVTEGGLISYAANYPDLARRSATYAAKIFGGAKPADLPVEQPVLLDLTINMKTAQALGLLIPRSLLVRATEVIE